MAGFKGQPNTGAMAPFFTPRAYGQTYPQFAIYAFVVTGGNFFPFFGM